MDADALSRSSQSELERIYRSERSLELPRGRFTGRVLHRLSHRGANHPLWKYSEWLGFEALRFGVDFDACVWLFTKRKIAMGRFTPEIGASRWRQTETVRLRYAVSRLLYDEVKPLSDDLCLGLGGINAGPGYGDHFFFSLRRSFK